MNTETGANVQFLHHVKDDLYNLLPAVIYSVKEATVNILVLHHTGNLLYTNVRNYDFFKQGENAWKFITQNQSQ